MALVLLRHAALPLKNQNRYNGWSDIEIDKELFEFKKVQSLKERSFDKIYASDLKRTGQTLEMLHLPYTIDKRLKEVAFKEKIEGKSFEEIEQLSDFKSQYLENETSWHNYIAKESQEEFETRVKEFLSTLDITQNILICSHGGTLKVIMKLLQQEQTPLSYLDYIEYDNYTIKFSEKK